MEERNVDIARRGYAAVVRGDVTTMRAFLAPDVKWHGGNPDDVGACRNRDQVLAFMQRAREHGMIGELVDVIDAGDRVVVLMRPAARAGQPSRLAANVTTFRNGQACEIVAFAEPEDAFAAAGVDAPELVGG